jgi:hypothetical protein
MTMQSEATATNHRDDANAFPTDCPWCLAVGALVLTVVTVLIFFW